MKTLYLMGIGFLLLSLTACATTVRKDYDAQGHLIGLTRHTRFIIQEEARLKVNGKYELEFQSQPDPESIQLLKAGVEMGKQMAR